MSWYRGEKDEQLLRLDEVSSVCKGKCEVERKGDL